MEANCGPCNPMCINNKERTVSDDMKINDGTPTAEECGVEDAEAVIEDAETHSFIVKEEKKDKPTLKDVGRSFLGLGRAAMRAAGSISPVKVSIKEDHPVTRKMERIKKAAAAAKDVLTEKE